MPALWSRKDVVRGRRLRARVQPPASPSPSAIRGRVAPLADHSHSDAGGPQADQTCLIVPTPLAIVSFQVTPVDHVAVFGELTAGIRIARCTPRRASSPRKFQRLDSLEYEKAARRRLSLCRQPICWRSGRGSNPRPRRDRAVPVRGFARAGGRFEFQRVVRFAQIPPGLRNSDSKDLRVPKAVPAGGFRPRSRRHRGIRHPTRELKLEKTRRSDPQRTQLARAGRQGVPRYWLDLDEFSVCAHRDGLSRRYERGAAECDPCFA